MSAGPRYTDGWTLEKSRPLSIPIQTADSSQPDEVQRMLELGMEKTMPSYVTCIEITVNGERCENRPAEGHDTCGVHLSQKVVRGVHRGES